MIFRHVRSENPGHLEAACTQWTSVERTRSSSAWRTSGALRGRLPRPCTSAGARVALTYQNERLRESVQALAAEIGDAPLFQCDMSVDEDVVNLYQQVGESLGSLSILVHSIAFANRDDLGGEFSKTERDGFRVALDVSAYSLIPMVRHAAPLMTEGGTVVAMTFLAAEKVFPGYNVMGVAKAALENSVRQLAAEYGPEGIRVNAISAGPLDHAVVARHLRLPRHETHPTPSGPRWRATSPTRMWAAPRSTCAASCRQASPARSFTSTPATASWASSPRYRNPAKSLGIDTSMRWKAPVS